MSIIVLTSASGSPGVTTTTLGLACTWTGPAIAVEADPVGGSAMLAGFFRGFEAPRPSAVDLLLAERAGRLAERFSDTLIPIESTEAAILPGPRSHAQAHNALDIWEPLSLVWRAQADQTVFVDAGRLGMESYPESLLRLADLVLLVTNSNLPGLAAAKQWAERASHTRQLQPEGPRWAVILVGPGQPYAAREVSAVLGLEVLACLSDDRRGAARYSQGTNPLRRTALTRDLPRCGAAIRARLAETHPPQETR